MHFNLFNRIKCGNLLMNNQFAVLVISCDKYSDLWEPFFQLFFKNWDTEGYKIYLGSNTKKCEIKNIINLLAGDDVDWSTGLKKILTQIPEKYIFLWLEDLFLIEKVNKDQLNSICEFMSKNDAKHIHFTYPALKPDRIINGDFGFYEKGMPYCVNVFGLWEKLYLQNLLLEGESPWNFEIMGSYRASYSDGFYCVCKPFFNYINTVEKGLWFPDKLKICQDLGLNIDLSKRGVLAGGYLVKSKIQMLVFNLIKLIKWKHRIRIMNFLRKLLISY